MNSARFGLVWSLAERYVNMAVTLASSMVLARTLTPENFGVFSLCAATIAIAATIREFGVADYIVQERNLTPAKLRGAFAVALTTAWVIGIALFLSRQVIGAYYDNADVSSLIGILSISFFILPLALPAYALMNREMEFRRIFVLQVITTLVQSTVAVVLALNDFGAYSLAWGSVTGVVTQAVAVAILRPKQAMIWPRFDGAGRIFRFGFYQMTSRILDTVTGSAHEFILARQFGFAQVGLFGRAKTLVDLFHTNIAGAMARVATPALANAHRANDSLVQMFSKGTSVFTSVCWPFFMFLALAAPEVVRLMFGPQWGQSVPIATLLAVGMLPSGLFALSGAVMAAMGQVERRLTVSLQWCPVHLVGLAICSQISVEAMAAVWIVTNGVIAIAFTRQLLKLLDTTLNGLFRPTLLSIPLVAATTLVQWLALHLMRALNLHPVVIVLVTAIASVLVWLYAVHVLKHPVRDEVQRISARLHLHGRFRRPT